MEPYTATLDLIVLRIKRRQAVRPYTNVYREACEIAHSMPVDDLDLAAHEVKWAEAAFIRKAEPKDVMLHKSIVAAVRTVCPTRGIKFLEPAPRTRI